MFNLKISAIGVKLANHYFAKSYSTVYGSSIVSLAAECRIHLGGRILPPRTFMSGWDLALFKGKPNSYVTINFSLNFADKI